MSTWQETIRHFPEANFLQSPAWKKANELIGHKVIVKSGAKYWCQMIVKDAKRGRYLEVPGGPLVDWNDRQTVEAVFAEIKAVGRLEKCVFIRLRPQVLAKEREKIEGLGLKKAPMHLHAEHTIILDLTKDLDALMLDMRRQTRYQIRQADKMGIKVRWSNTKDDFEEFHKVQAETAARQHFIPPDLKTLMAEHEAFGDKARIYMAETNINEPIAYGLILMDGNEAEYFEAASTELNHKLPGAYALQWRVIQDLKELGIKRYNLWGIAPENQPEHRYAKVTTFKRGFGGIMTTYVPAQDVILKPARYQLDLLVETVRRKRRKL